MKKAPNKPIIPVYSLEKESSEVQNMKLAVAEKHEQHAVSGYETSADFESIVFEPMPFEESAKKAQALTADETSGYFLRSVIKASSRTVRKITSLQLPKKSFEENAEDCET